MNVLFGDQSPELVHAKQVLKSKNSISYYWSEKAWVTFDFLQIYGLVWCAANPWPWPYLWIGWTNFVIWANLDYFSYTPDGALRGRTTSLDIPQWGMMKDYYIYALVYSFVPFFILCYIYYSERYFKEYGKRNEVKKPVFIRNCLYVLHALYLPCCLGAFRMYYCQPDGYLSADTSMVCWEGMHLIATIVTSLFILPVFFYVPYWTREIINNCVIYQDPADHEKRIQVWELMYMLGVNTYWSDEQVWLISSLKRQWCYYHYDMLLMKAVLLFIFIFIRPNVALQAVALWLVLTLFTVKLFNMSPFRVGSTTVVARILYVILMIDLSFGVMNSVKMRSAFLVASTQTIWMATSNALLFLGYIVYMTMFAFNPYAVWPTASTLGRMRNHANVIKYAEYIEDMIAAREFRGNVYRQNIYENLDVVKLDGLIELLRSHWLAARSCGSLLTIPLSDEVEVLLLMRHSMRPKAFRKSECWNDVMVTEEQSTGTSLQQILHRRNKATSLMNPVKKRILTKLFAIRALVGDKVLKPSPNEDIVARSFDHDPENLDEDEGQGLFPHPQHSSEDLAAQYNDPHSSEDLAHRYDDEEQHSFHDVIMDSFLRDPKVNDPLRSKSHTPSHETSRRHSSTRDSDSHRSTQYLPDSNAVQQPVTTEESIPLQYSQAKEDEDEGVDEAEDEWGGGNDEESPSGEFYDEV